MGHQLDGRMEPAWIAVAGLRVRQAAARLAPLLIVVAVLVVALALYRYAYYEVPGEAVARDLEAGGGVPSPAPTPTEPLAPAARGELINQARTAAVQALGGIVIAVGAVLTVRNLRLTRDGQITDRFNDAVQHLGGERVSVRVAAIHALGRIARDSRADQGAVMAILGDHLREYCPWPVPSRRPTGASKKVDGAPYAEVNAAARVLRQRRPGRDDGVLDFSGIDWRDAPLSGVRLRGANLVGANLKDAYLNGADLEDAVLARTTLRGASLRGANLRGAWLGAADFSHADAERADFAGAKNLKTAAFEETTLVDASFDDGQRPAGGIFERQSDSD
jgi:hypothetical protein